MQCTSLTAPVDINSDRNVCVKRNLDRVCAAVGQCPDLSVQFPINARRDWEESRACGAAVRQREMEAIGERRRERGVRLEASPLPERDRTGQPLISKLRTAYIRFNFVIHPTERKVLPPLSSPVTLEEPG